MPHIIEVFNAGENLLSQIDSPEIWTTFTSLFKMTWNSRNYVGWSRGVDIPFKVQIVTNINFHLTFSYIIKSIVLENINKMITKEDMLWSYIKFS